MDSGRHVGTPAPTAWDSDDLALIDQRAFDRRQHPWSAPHASVPSAKANSAHPQARRTDNAVALERDSLAAAIDTLGRANQHDLFDCQVTRGSVPFLNATDAAEPEIDYVEVDDLELDAVEIDDGGEVGFDETAAPDDSLDFALLDDVPDDLLVGAATDDDEPPLFEIDVDGVALDRYGKAERLTYETILRRGLDRETAYPVLLDIFFESPWWRTRKAVEELAEAGATVETLALAAAIRRMWRNHPEFAQPALHVTGARGRWYQSPTALGSLTWAGAAALANAWTSYPDIEEIERLLERLFDEWGCRGRLRRQFLNFRFFVMQLATSVAEPIDDWLERFFDANDGGDDRIDRLEQPAWRPNVRIALRGYGIDVPRGQKTNHRHPALGDEADG